ncbi:MAG: lysophospholipid acyltransferase family protein [Myxococcota bacterium]|nr:lysophospholipid acyltransferase family protein [Myxococcota bacterium]
MLHFLSPRVLYRLCSLLVATMTHGFALRQGDAPTITRRWGQRLSKLLGFEVVVEGAEPESGGLLIASHRSYSDVPVLMGLCPCRFLSKAEVRSWPIIGWAAARAGTIFVQRSDPKSRKSARAQLRTLLQDGSFVMVFPEGTTTPKGTLAPLRPGMFREAVEAQLPVTLVAIEYDEADCAWTSEESFLVHFARVFRTASLTVRVFFSEPLLPVEGEECAAFQGRCERWLREKIGELNGLVGPAPAPDQLFDPQA